MPSARNDNHHHEEVWIKRIRSGDHRIFEILFKEYYTQLSRFAYGYVKSNAIAEDLVQEVFTVIWEKREELEIETGLRSYLYKSVRNHSLNHLKRLDIKQKYDSQWMENMNRPKSSVFKEAEEEKRLQHIREKIGEAVEELPPRSKMTYKLHRHDGLTYQEIAEVMDVSVKTVESQMTRTLKLLRHRLSAVISVISVLLLQS